MELTPDAGPFNFTQKNNSLEIDLGYQNCPPRVVVNPWGWWSEVVFWLQAVLAPRPREVNRLGRRASSTVCWPSVCDAVICEARCGVRQQQLYLCGTWGALFLAY